MRGLAAIAGALLSGCFAPSFGDGQFVCGPADECPPGFTCDGDGACVRDPAGPDPIDAAVVEDPDAPPAPPLDAAAPPDAARPPQPARVYTLDTTSTIWSHEAATSYFGGPGAPVPEQIQTGWAHCAVIDAAILCVGTDDSWHCTDDGAISWFGAKWGVLFPDLKTHSPTFTTAFDTGLGVLKQVSFNAEERWWDGLYFLRPRRLAGTSGEWTVMVTESYESPGRDIHSVEWDGVANAPPSGSAITADFQIAGMWHLWTADGTQYRFDEDGWKSPGPATILSEDGAPPPELITAASMCGDDLYVVTRGD